MKNFVYGISQLVALTHFHPLTSAEKQHKTFDIIYFVLLLFLPLMKLTKCSLVTDQLG